MSVTITSANFEEEVLLSKKPVLVDFWAVWCGPCQMQGPILEAVEAETDTVVIAKLNVDEVPELAQKYGVMSIPTLILFKDGQAVETRVGVQPKDAVLDMIQA